MSKKICFVVNRYEPYIGGTEILCKGVIQEFTKYFKEHSITLVTEPISERIISNYSFNVHEIYLDNKENYQSYFKNQNYDLTIFFADLHTHYLNYYDYKLSKKNVCILNVDERTYNARNNFPKAIQNLKNFDLVTTFCKQAPVNVFLTENNIKNTYVSNFSRDTLKSNLRFDINIREKFNISRDKIIVSCFASFEERKNQLYLLEKASKLDKNKYHWIFVGRTKGNEEYANLCHKVANLNGLSTTFIKGTNNHDLIDTILVQSDLTILTSIAEGMPLSIIESMSAGIPWISTPVGGIVGVCSDMISGEIFKSLLFDEKDLEEAINKTLLKNSDVIRSEWLNNFSIELVTKQYNQIFKELIND